MAQTIVEIKDIPSGAIKAAIDALATYVQANIGGGGAAAASFVIVVNQGANAISVYPHSTGVINEQSASAAITVQPNTAGLFTTTGTLTASATPATGLTASGTNQGTAFALTSLLNIISTAGANTGVVLPTSTTDVWVSVP